MDITSVIKKRRSIRKYKPKKVPKRLLRKILEAARWAPSIHNLQPWKFIVVEGELKKKLVKVLKAYRGKELLFVRIVLKRAVEAIESAPAIILVYKVGVFSRKIKFDKLHFDKANIWSNNANIWEIQSVACAIQNMLIVTHSLGLGAVWLGVPMFREKQINKLFGVKDKLMAILAIGYPDERVPAPPRKPMSEIASFRK